MGVFTFVCRESGGDWTAKQINGDLEATADGTYDLQRKLVQAALAGSTDAVQSSFSFVTPTSAVFQVSVGGGVYVASSGGDGRPPAEAPAEEEKKEEEKEESDDDMGISLFDD